MKSILTFFTILILLQSCSAPIRDILIIVEKDIVVSKGKRIEKEFIPYLREFEERCFIKPNINIRFGALDDGTVGLCVYGGTEPNIIIDEFSWIRYTQAQREVLLYHELGHCTLYRPHNEEYEMGKPVSIMYPIVLDKYTYESNREYYLNELCEI